MVNSCQKGKAGERDCAHALEKVFPGCGARRGVQYQGGPDSPDVVGLPGVHVEVKRVERGLNLEAALKQADADKGAGDVPVVLHRRNRERWKATCWLDDLPGLVKAIMAAQPLQCSSKIVQPK